MKLDSKTMGELTHIYSMLRGYDLGVLMLVSKRLNTLIRKAAVANTVTKVEQLAGKAKSSKVVKDSSVPAKKGRGRPRKINPIFVEGVNNLN